MKSAEHDVRVAGGGWPPRPSSAMPKRAMPATLTLIVLLWLTAGQVVAQGTHYAEHTPGFQAMAQGSWHYERGAYARALRMFDKAAYWGDKMGQHNLGVIWYHGQGVEADPARAWAWFELAAERDYPEFRQIAGEVWNELDADQRARAQRIHDELYSDYGDANAVPRTSRRMIRERRRVTGSRTGFAGFVTVYDGSLRGARGPEDYYAEDKWDFSRVIQREKQIFEALARSRVSLHELELIDEDDSDDPERSNKR